MTRDWRVVPIEELRLSELKSLLEQQAAEWRSALFWDFKRTAIHTFFLAELRALTGSALLNADGRAAGYACFEFQGRSAEFTHFYVAPEFRSIDANTCLLATPSVSLRLKSTTSLQRPPFPTRSSSASCPCCPRSINAWRNRPPSRM